MVAGERERLGRRGTRPVWAGSSPTLHLWPAEWGAHPAATKDIPCDPSAGIGLDPRGGQPDQGQGPSGKAACGSQCQVAWRPSVCL